MLDLSAGAFDGTGGVSALKPGERWTVLEGDCNDLLPGIGAVDAVVCDPPYALTSGNAKYDLRLTGAGNERERRPKGPRGGFMGKAWDSEIPGAATWALALAAAKPGAHLLAFGGTRTFHRLTCAIEDAGWEIRDCLSWLYGSGFPKSHNGAWGGTALKPGWEPIVMARKPLIGTVEANHAAHGTGGLNIDEARCATGDDLNGGAYSGQRRHRTERTSTDTAPGAAPLSRLNRGIGSFDAPAGRWPANAAMDEEAAAMLDEQAGERKSSGIYCTDGGTPKGWSGGKWADAPREAKGYNDLGGASRFFYCAKASRSEREQGLEGQPEQRRAADYRPGDDGEQGLQSRRHGATSARNHHPTVKPVSLMRWLVRLVTPEGGVVLDPFAGSGSTGVAAVMEGRRFIGIEREAQYVEIARRRIADVAAQGSLFDRTGTK